MTANRNESLKSGTLADNFTRYGLWITFRIVIEQPELQALISEHCSRAAEALTSLLKAAHDGDYLTFEFQRPSGRAFHRTFSTSGSTLIQSSAHFFRPNEKGDITVKSTEDARDQRRPDDLILLGGSGRAYPVVKKVGSGTRCFNKPRSDPTGLPEVVC